MIVLGNGSDVVCGARIIDVKETSTTRRRPGADTFAQRCRRLSGRARGSVFVELRRQLGQSRRWAAAGDGRGLLPANRHDHRQRTHPQATGLGADRAPDSTRLGFAWRPRPEIAVSAGLDVSRIFGDAIACQTSTPPPPYSPQASNLSYDGLFVRGKEFREESALGPSLTIAASSNLHGESIRVHAAGLEQRLCAAVKTSRNSPSRHVL